MRPDCFFCHIKTIETIINKFTPPREIGEQFINEINTLFCTNNDLPNPYLATLIHRKASETFKCDDIYSKEKSDANKILLQNYSALKYLIKSSDDPFDTAVKLAVAGNIIDYGAHSVNANIEKQLLRLVKKPFKIDKTARLKEAIKKATNILYLGDNAGEIVCDKLLIEHLDHPCITYVTRGKAVINDVTLEDVKITGLNSTCHAITNGFDAPSTLPEYCSDEFSEAFNAADLIISKGQGNFEGLMHLNRQNIFYLLMAKCNPIAEILGVEKGDLLVTENSNTDAF